MISRAFCIILWMLSVNTCLQCWLLFWSWWSPLARFCCIYSATCIYSQEFWFDLYWLANTQSKTWEPDTYIDMRRQLWKPGLWMDRKNRLWSDATSSGHLIRAWYFCHICASAENTFNAFCTIWKIWILILEKRCYRKAPFAPP